MAGGVTVHTLTLTFPPGQVGWGVAVHTLTLTFPPGQGGWGVTAHTGAGHTEDVLRVNFPSFRVARDRRYLRRIYKHVS